MPIFTEKAKNIKIPELVPVEQVFDTTHIDNIEEAVLQQIKKEEINKNIIKGQKIAIAVGSRGISAIDKIVKATIDFLKFQDTYPFIVPAMGSHGGGTAAGQLEILESYGISEKTMGVPVVTGQEVIQIGTTKSGVPVVIDKQAYEADMIIVINRIKCHTDFSGKYESGLCKMLAIGLGKHEGCTCYHKEGFDAFPDILPEIASIVIENVNVGFGLAIIENAYGKIYSIDALNASDILKKEPELLLRAKQLKPSIMIRDIDLLIVEEIGKDISGGGIDPKITGILGYKEKWRLKNFVGPNIKNVFVLGLSRSTHGNANGLGIADFTLRSIYEQIDFDTTYSNALAARALDGVKIPMMVDSYEEGIMAAFIMTGYDDISQLKIVKIANTLKLDRIEVTENLLPEILKNKKMKILE